MTKISVESNLDDILIPRSYYGYHPDELKTILRKLKVTAAKFKKAFGVNTCALCACCNEILLYKCDIEMALKIVKGYKPNAEEWD